MRGSGKEGRGSLPGGKGMGTGIFEHIAMTHEGAHRAY